MVSSCIQNLTLCQCSYGTFLLCARVVLFPALRELSSFEDMYYCISAATTAAITCRFVISLGVLSPIMMSPFLGSTLPSDIDGSRVVLPTTRGLNGTQHGISQPNSFASDGEGSDTSHFKASLRILFPIWRTALPLPWKVHE